MLRRDKHGLNEHTHKWAKLEGCFEGEARGVGRAWEGVQEGFPEEVAFEM